LLEICDEMNSLQSRQTFKGFHSVKLALSLEIGNKGYSLEGIIYFQNRHYTAHVKGISHNKLTKIQSTEWNFHDEMQNEG